MALGFGSSMPAECRRDPRRARWLAACLLVGLWACGDSPRLPQPTPLTPTTLPCEPACPEGYACNDGSCYAVCDPECPEGTHCTADGSCVGDLADGPGAAFARNPCGGQSALPGLPGDPCGPCGTGRYVCQSEDVVDCVDPVGTNACGGCGDLPGVPAAPCGDDGRWACDPSGQLQCVPWLDMNPCLGTEVLDGPPGRRCGECGAGYFACDGQNETRCVEGTPPDGSCACDPATSPAVPCDTDAGICTRGVRLCNAAGEYGSCVVAEPGAPCQDDADCGPDARCVDETVAPDESPDDDCHPGSPDGCTRRICRTLPAATRGCQDDADCAPSQGCAAGLCRDLAVRPVAERCNGLDDDCDGRIDNDDQRVDICGQCPFDMALVVNPDRLYGRERFCVDLYEASRPDATDAEAGRVESYATSRPGVLPWSGVTAQDAILACSAKVYDAEVPGGTVERRLCLADEFTIACNQRGERYPYGDDYLAGACNDASVGLDDPLPTGSAPACVYAEPGSLSPVYDMSGNVAEWVRGDTGVVLAGGSIDDGAEAVACGSTQPGPGPDLERLAHVGFRCCAAPSLVPEQESVP